MLAGKPLAEHSTSLIKEVFGAIALVVKDASEADGLEYDKLWLDSDEKRHPLAGIVTALEHSDIDRMFICACDLPLVSASSIDQLYSASEADRVVVATSSGRLQPLLAVYPSSLTQPLKDALSSEFSLIRTVSDMDAIQVELPAEELFNVNTRADRERAESILGGRNA